MSEPQATPKFWELLEAAVSGEITDDQRTELESLLAGNPELQKTFLEHVQLRIDVRLFSRARQSATEVFETALHDAAKPAKPSPCDAKDKSLPLRVYCFFAQPTPLSMSVAALVVGLMITAMAFMAPPFYRALVREEDDAPTGQYEIVAELSGKHAVEWTDANDSMHRGAFLLPGRELRLDKGIVEITYRDGAVVMLSGPCEYVVQNLGRGELKRGTLLASVPESAIGFTIATPLAEIEDLGTEFGVAVDESGGAEVQVLQGAVELARGTNGNGPQRNVRLTQGESASISLLGEVTRIDQDVLPDFAALLNRRDLMNQQRESHAIVGVTILDSSSELVSGQHDRRASYVVDGSGLSGRSHSPMPDGNMWETHGLFETPNDPLPAHVTFDLGAAYLLTGIRVWNYNESALNLTSVGAREVEISVSPTEDPADLAPLVTAGGKFEFPRADGTSTYVGFDVPLDGAANTDVLARVRLVRFSIVNNHGGGEAMTGLSEVRFRGQLAD